MNWDDEDDMRIGGMGANGCTCSITACFMCPIHGDEKHLNYLGKQMRKDREAVIKKWNDWIEGDGSCFDCGAEVVGRANRLKHQKWHGGMKNG